MNNKVYLLGGEQTDFQRNWSKEGKTILSLMRETVFDALEQVRIDLEEIVSLNANNKIGVFVGNFDAEQYVNQGHLGSFFTEIDHSFYGVPSARYEAACASSSVAIDAAATKIRSGEYDVAIVLGIEMMKTVDAKTGADFLGTAAYYEKEAKDIDFPFPRIFGQLADLLVEKYRLDERRFMANLAAIATINYANAKKNPKAQTRTWFMNNEHANNRATKHNPIVAGRLSITDCSQITDGAAMIVLASEKFTMNYANARCCNILQIPTIKGWGHRNAPLLFSTKREQTLTGDSLLPWTAQAVSDAYARANMAIDQIDFIETHDCFTSSEYAAISAFGLTLPGREYEAIESGRIALDGSTPINPSGGLIGVGHPVGASGVRMMLDLYKQVTNSAGDYQVHGAKNGVMLNIGGSATTNYSFVVGI